MWSVVIYFMGGGAATFEVKACCKHTAEDKGRALAREHEPSQIVTGVRVNPR